MASRAERTQVHILLALLITACGCGASRHSTGESAHRSDAEQYRNLSQLRQDVIREAKRWLGTPYRYRGTDAAGMDCSGLVSTAFARTGISLPRTARDMYKRGKSTSVRERIPGDLVFFRNTAGKGITHVGIYLGGYSFIHSSTTRGVIVSSLNDQYYRAHYAGARDVLGEAQ